MSEKIQEAKGLRLAFGCQKGVGKDTACSHLCKEHGGHIFAFSDPLYEIMYLAQQKLGMEQKKNRSFLRAVGMWARQEDEDIWVKQVEKKINSTSQESNIFISDVRFLNEAKFLKKMGFTLIHICRSRQDIGSLIDNHVSETSLLNYSWDIELNNDGTLEEFFDVLSDLVE